MWIIYSCFDSHQTSTQMNTYGRYLESCVRQHCLNDTGTSSAVCYCWCIQVQYTGRIQNTVMNTCIIKFDHLDSSLWVKPIHSHICSARAHHPTVRYRSRWDQWPCPGDEGDLGQTLDDTIQTGYFIVPIYCMKEPDSFTSNEHSRQFWH